MGSGLRRNDTARLSRWTTSMNLVARATRILLTPKTEWKVIDGETGDHNYLFTRYVAFLAAVPAAAMFVRFSPPGPGRSTGAALVLAVICYAGLCIAWYVQALVINALAPTFGGQKNSSAALKVSTYSFTALWLAEIFGLIPALSFLSILGFYSIYLVWSGLPILMKAPPDRAIGYTAAAIVIMLVITLVITLAPLLLLVMFLLKGAR
jgi:Yip1-like protein